MKTPARTRVVIVGSIDRQIEDLLRDTGAQVSTSPMEALSALGQAGAVHPDAVLVDVRAHAAVPAALPSFKRNHPDAGVVIVASSMDPALMLEAMRAGVSEWIAEPLTAPALTAAIQRVTQKHVPATELAQVFAFVGAKGGVGTTTVAVNVATALARSARRRKALLVDLHLAHGDAGLFLGVEPRFTTADALENIHRLDETFLNGVISNTKAGVHLLASAEHAVAPAHSPERVRQLIEFAAGHYGYIVLDVPRSDMTMLDSLQLASSIIVIANQELATVRRAGALALALRQRYGKDRIGVVINRFDRAADIGREDVERVTGGRVRHVIPSDYRIALDGLNKGLPVVVENHNRLAGSFTALARLLAGVESEPTLKQEKAAVGLFGRLGIARP
jgi:pilus assembly protein CpaE